MTIFFRYAKTVEGFDTTSTTDISNTLKDAAKISDYALDAVKWSVAIKLILGDDKGSFNPQNNATRAEVATMITRFDKMLKALDGAEK